MTNSIQYEKVLNPAQLEAVMNIDGPVLVIAGAGSGKTRTLIYRVARLIETGIQPDAILLLTFTRKSAEEMLERAAGLSDSRCRFVSGGTFHSLGHRVLRTHAELLGYPTSFTILDRPDMEEVIHSLVPELGLPKNTLRFPKRNTLANILSKAANLQRPASELMEEEYAQFLEFLPHINRLTRFYTEYKYVHHMRDYDDLILDLRKLLAENIDVRTTLSRQYRYVMVDEYQDTNSIQADIVKWLAHDHQNIMAVGDDSQSIYSFRGANYRNMFDFPTLFPKTKVIKLEENYRSTQPILALTNALMDQASKKFTKCLFTKRSGGEQPKVINTGTEPEQAGFICRYIKEHIQKNRPISDIAVLFRAGYHSFQLEAELARQGFPFKKYGGFKFLDSAHIKDFLAHLRIVVNMDETVSWVRILRLIKNVGPARTRSIIQWMKDNKIPPERIGEWPGAGKTDNGLKALSSLIADLGHMKKAEPKASVEQVMKYYVPILQERFDDYPRRQKELEQLLIMAQHYKQLREFLDDLVLEPPRGPADIAAGKKTESLTLSTVHSAKGLEWPVVFVIWVTEGRFPSTRAHDNPTALEEELRLMYVAATRAKDQLIMCYPGKESTPSWQNYSRGGGRSGNDLSSFIQNLPHGTVSHETLRNFGKMPGKRPGKRPTSLYHLDKTRPNAQGKSSRFSQGDMVRHPAFGPGVVSKFIGDDKVEVLFRNAGRKLLHLEYTTLERI